MVELAAAGSGLVFGAFAILGLSFLIEAAFLSLLAGGRDPYDSFYPEYNSRPQTR